MPRPVEVTTDARAPWRTQLDCETAAVQRPALAGAWTDEFHRKRTTAQSICDGCRSKLQCLLDALSDPNATGLRAGFYFVDGGVDRDDSERMREQYEVRPRLRQRTPEGA